MSLSKDEAAKHGLQFSIEGESYPGAPDIEVWEADLTLDGHTWHFVGKSEDEVLEQADRALKTQGRIDKDESGVGEAEPTQAQESDVADLAAFRGQRDETAEELAKQADQEDHDAPIAPGEQRR